MCDIVGMMDMETGCGPGDGFEWELGEGTGSGRLLPTGTLGCKGIGCTIAVAGIPASATGGIINTG
jgi:hypothetical protein